MSAWQLTWSEDRLWKLIEARCRPGADTERIDERIWNLYGETWSVMFTDLSGFSRQVERFGITHFLQVIFEKRRLLLPIVEDHDGILVKADADSFLLLFRRATSALAAARAMQATCRETNAERPPEERILLCVGIGHGRILRIGDTDIWGAEVNAASKLGEDTAKADEILLTEGACTALAADDATLRTEPLGVPIPGTPRAYRLIS